MGQRNVALTWRADGTCAARQMKPQGQQQQPSQQQQQQQQQPQSQDSALPMLPKVASRPPLQQFPGGYPAPPAVFPYGGFNPAMFGQWGVPPAPPAPSTPQQVRGLPFFAAKICQIFVKYLWNWLGPRGQARGQNVLPVPGPAPAPPPQDAPQGVQAAGDGNQGHGGGQPPLEPAGDEQRGQGQGQGQGQGGGDSSNVSEGTVSDN